MKVKIISRSPEEYTRERTTDLLKVHRNFDPALHPFEKAREVTRAVNATKLDRVFAKPFVAALDGHTDAVNCFATSPQSLVHLVSGGCDGQIKLWNISSRKNIWSVQAHEGFVTGLAVVPEGDAFFSCGADRKIKLWRLDAQSSGWMENIDEPVQTYVGNLPFNSISHHRNRKTFATASSVVDIWDSERADPITSLRWGADSITKVCFNQVETNILASVGNDRGTVFYDLRSSSPLTKLTMQMRSNALAWNPMEAFNFTIANEDQRLYTYDMRKVDKALNVHKDHVMAVMDVSYSPTGREFVSGSYDCTVRIFDVREGHSREIYHTKRMQRIFCVKYTDDARFILTGSDDCNIRIWKSEASKALGVMAPRQQHHEEYMNKLKKRYAHIPIIAKIRKQRHVPKMVHSMHKRTHIMNTASKRREDNKRKHSAPGKMPYRKEREAAIVGVSE